MAWFNESVSHKKKFLASLLKAPLEQLGEKCLTVWDQADILSATLQESLCKLPHCQLLYAINLEGRQVCANISRNGNDDRWRGQDLSLRPYLQGNLPFKGLVLSAAYLSQRSMQPCITALQAIRNDHGLLGFIAADFHLKDLPVVSISPLKHAQWQQQRNPSDRQYTLSSMPSQQSALDENIDYLIYVMTTLMQEHGIFYCTLNFTNAMSALWSRQDPCIYRVYSVAELMKAELFHNYPRQDYDNLAVEAEKIPLVLAQLKALRVADDTIYLQSGSLNIINRMVELTFSNGESQFMHIDEFLNRDLAYWVEQQNGQKHALENTIPN